MHWAHDLLEKYPELAIFLTLGIGYAVGKIRIGSFKVGAVTGTLLTGVLVGQLDITVAPVVKSFFFLLFLFAMGYQVGPQFVHGLKKEGLPQVLFAVIVCVVGLASAYAGALILGYNPGQGAGLLSGALTQSAAIGVASDSINALHLAPEEQKSMISFVVVGYAITYIFGTIGAAWFLSSIGPKILRINLVEECKKLEEQVGVTATNEEVSSSYRFNVYRAYRVESSHYIGKTIEEIEQFFRDKGNRIFILKVKTLEGMVDATPQMTLRSNDIVVVGMTKQNMDMFVDDVIGEEVFDEDFFDFSIETLDVVVSSKAVRGMTIHDISFKTLTRGVYVQGIKRQGEMLPRRVNTKVHRGDVLILVGPQSAVDGVAKKIGYPAHRTSESDMIFVGFGVLLGGLIGIPTAHIAGIPLSLTTSGGALIMGLIFGWLRSLYPTFGRIPEGAVWVFNNVGLTTFVAVVGISAGPGFVSGIKQSGLSMFIAGIFVTLIPLLVGVLIGKYFFKFHPAITLGACAGSQTTTAAIGAITEAAKSQVPVLGYTVTYAVGNILLTVWGAIIVALLPH
ncbi:aspartate-alanine antiporter [Paenibacillus selenitireducens]|uniref:Aspartate-alanine antiporter n=1 Tax=Paenibacillus selenitireducens TaxID=1324314 RepID=A0A1T2XI88_9BACL|nr:aspartate-alanine antiporter [Paenibacillus selenitireducens]